MVSIKRLWNLCIMYWKYLRTSAARPCINFLCIIPLAFAIKSKTRARKIQPIYARWTRIWFLNEENDYTRKCSKSDIQVDIGIVMNSNQRPCSVGWVCLVFVFIIWRRLHCLLWRRLDRCSLFLTKWCTFAYKTRSQQNVLIHFFKNSRQTFPLWSACRMIAAARF